MSVTEYDSDFESPGLSPAPTLIGIDLEEGKPLLTHKRESTPLPKLQLAVICFAKLAEPIAFTQIFPYINQMVEELHITDNPSDVGFYSGLIDSLLALTQITTIYHWGCLSDRIGRKPVVLWGLVGIAFASLFFGLSTSFWQILLFRAIAGGLSGNTAVIQSVISDITDETNQSRAFPLTSMTWCIGCVIGPFIGGIFSHPAERYPNIFGGIELFESRPFFLPCLVSCLFTLLSVLVVALCLEESLPTKVAERRRRQLILKEEVKTPSYGSIDLTDAFEALPPPPKKSTSELLAMPAIRYVLVAQFFLSFIGIAYETVLTLWAYTPIRLGGLGREPAAIGYALSGTGTVGIVCTIVIFPALHRRWDTPTLYATFMSIWPFLFLYMPLFSILVKDVMQATGQPITKHSSLGGLWTGVGGLLVLGRVASMAFPSGNLMAKSVAPDVASVGSVFGLTGTVAAIGEAAGPAFVSCLFAASTHKHILGGHFVWVVMIALSAIGAVATRRLKQLDHSRF